MKRLCKGFIIVFFIAVAFLVVALMGLRFLKISNQESNTNISVKSTRMPDKSTPPRNERKSFTNTAFHYTIDYPTYMSVTGDDFIHLETSRGIYIGASRNKKRDYILVYVNEKAKDMTLKEYVQQEWKENTPQANPQTQNQQVSIITGVRLAREDGLQFTVTGGFSYDGGNGEWIDETKLTVIFIRKNGLVYQLSYPSNDNEYQHIADSFRILQ